MRETMLSEQEAADMFNGQMLKQAIIRLNDSMAQSGRAVNPARVADIVAQQAFAAAATASGAELGGKAAMDTAGAAACAMYGRLAAEMDVRLKPEVIRAAASAVTADLAGAVVVSVAANSAIMLFPGADPAEMAQFTLLYLAALVFIGAVARLDLSRARGVSAGRILLAAGSAQIGMDLRRAMREARRIYRNDMARKSA